MFRVTPKETVFFTMFLDTSKLISTTAEMLEDLMVNYVNVNEKIKAIKEKEHECDISVHNILKQLNKSFITPIDREDIHIIAKELDNITDEIEATAHRFMMLNVKSIRPDAVKFAKLIVKCTKELEMVMGELADMKKSKILNEKIIEVNRIENEGDDLFRSSITNLFVNETDTLDVIKWKEIFELLENTLDACEDVANIVEGVVMKHV